MIHLSNIAVEESSSSNSDWQVLLRQSKITTAELLQKVGLQNHPLADSNAEDLFELRAPRPYIEKIKPGDPNDPLLLQILPQNAEYSEASGYSTDPLNEAHFSPAKGIIHKYKSRVLLIVSQACAINCRYCFRRHFPYPEHRQSTNEWHEALHYVRTRPEINEVILSGGDPMILNDSYLSRLMTEIDSIPHIKRIRIHSRLIISLPQRVTTHLIALFKRLSTKLIIVIHCNHPNEIGADVTEALDALQQSGVTLLNQSVLLNRINDQTEILVDLSEKLFAAGVLPYYLFTLDKISGAAHFDLPVERCRELYQGMLNALPGFLVPRLVKEVPGKRSKTPLGIDLVE